MGRVITNADYIRSLNDKDLARFLTILMSQHRAAIIGRLHAQGLISDIEISESPLFSEAANLVWLRESVADKGGYHCE